MSQQLNLGERVRHLRLDRGLTLAQVGKGSSLSTSTLSKIENNRLSPTVETLSALAEGLGVGVDQLFTGNDEKEPVGRRAVTRSGQGKKLSTKAYDYELLCTEIWKNKRLFPILAHVKLGSVQEFGPLSTHAGEEIIFVVSGKIALHTDVYETLILEAGDCTFFDSRMPHGCTAVGDDDAVILWVCSHRDAIDQAIVRSGKDDPSEA